MAEPITGSIIGAAAAFGVMFLTIFFTRENTSSGDHTTVKRNSEDIVALMKTSTDQQTTLATHTAIHAHTEKRMDKLADDVEEVKSYQDRQRGRDERHRS